MSRGWRGAARRGSRGSVTRAACGAVALALLALSPRPAAGHRFAPGLLLLSERSPGVFAVTFRPPPAGVEEAPAALIPALPAGCRPIGGAAEAGAPPPLVDCGAAGPAGVYRLSGHGPGEVVVEVRRLGGASASGVLRGAGDSLALGPPGAGAPALAASKGAAASAGAVLTSYLRLGFLHILGGWDHLLLLAALLLLVPGAGALLRTLTAFTLAHSVTLGLSALGLLRVPPAPVEALIALSVALLAAELVRGGRAADRTLAGRRPALVAFLFGLLHGLGFAGALGEAGLPPGRVPLALLSFNLGVEAGQVLVVLCLLPFAAALRRRRALLPSAYAMGALAMAWTLERLAQLGAP